MIVRGFGLAFIDLMILLTEGRGGRYETGPSGRLVYRPSGKEPRLFVGSRRGVPYRAKPEYPLRGERAKLPRFFGQDEIRALVSRSEPLDFRRDVWPLMAKDIGWGYYTELFTGHPDRVRFLAEGLRLREQNGRLHDLDVVGRPDTFTVPAALAAVTDRLGLAGTINSTFTEPYEVARRFTTLDHLSAGRAAGNVVTSWDAFTGENFRRGGFLTEDQRYSRARSFLDAASTLFDSWDAGAVLADKESGRFLAAPTAGAFSVHDEHFDISGRFAVPRQAGDLPGGRLRRGPGVRRRHRRRHLQPTHDFGSGPGIPRRREVPAAALRPQA